MKTVNLFEYENREDIPFSNSELEDLEIFLDNIWSARAEVNDAILQNNNDIEQQRFIQILRQTNQFKANKYVGVIKFIDKQINLLPKIFYQNRSNLSNKEIITINHHLIWWLSYSGKVRFPNYLSSMSSTSCDFLELIIYYFSFYTKNLLSSLMFLKYEDVEKESKYVKGRVDFNRYLTNNYVQGRWQEINCIFDQYNLDNSFNQAIKYVATLLLSITESSENKANLREIIMILDEVSDTSVTVEELKMVCFNPFLDDYQVVKDYCLLFLQNSISFSFKNEMRMFAFLLPMEQLFESFIYGFISKEIGEIKARSQVTAKYFDDDKFFNLRPDLILTCNDMDIIADTKYKAIRTDLNPSKRITVSDLYQVTTYAIRFGIDKIILFYPMMIDDEMDYSQLIVVDDEFSSAKIEIKIVKLPVINRDLYSDHEFSRLSIDEIFSKTTKILKDKILEEVRW